MQRDPYISHSQGGQEDSVPQVSPDLLAPTQPVDQPMEDPFLTPPVHSVTSEIKEEAKGMEGKDPESASPPPKVARVE